ncbi:MAG: DUF6868 family protein [Pyrinomonadaceae bacterium]
MTIETLRHFFAWSAVINYAMLLLWFFLYLVAHGFFVGLSQRFFGVSAEKYDSISLKAMFFFKLSIWLFCIAPYLALRIMS